MESNPPPISGTESGTSDRVRNGPRKLVGSEKRFLRAADGQLSSSVLKVAVLGAVLRFFTIEGARSQTTTSGGYLVSAFLRLRCLLCAGSDGGPAPPPLDTNLRAPSPASRTRRGARRVRGARQRAPFQARLGEPTARETFLPCL